jgi:hypothetical protein
LFGACSEQLGHRRVFTIITLPHGWPWQAGGATAVEQQRHKQSSGKEYILVMCHQLEQGMHKQQGLFE